ncbi:MAG TPA: MFS transporter [Chthoniobacterales bacterium]|jgi:MFS family permease|nr:MFS transporter [Chthoniobacterales bacterium]
MITTGVTPTIPDIPPQATNSFRFSLFNAVNFQITLGAPMVLYAKALGGSATTIGIVASLAPLMTILQLPTAYFIPKVGYKGFVLFGWSVRAVLLFMLAILPLLVFLPGAIQTQLMLVCLFLFNVVRGISTGAWLPWLTALVPANARGAFLRSDQFHMQCGGMLAIAIATIVLWSGGEPWQFSLLFVISGLAGMLSLHFVRKIPDIEIGEQAKSSGQPVPWLQILKYPPFAKLLIFNVVYNWVVGGLAAFVIAFLEGRAGYTAGQVLAVSLAAAVGAFATVPFFGLILERTGSKPLLRLAMSLYLVGILFWVLITSGILPAHYLLIGFNYLILGVAGGLFSIANTRIAMDTMPTMGRNHFFSLFTVFASLSLGLAPIFWGVFLDILGRKEFSIGFFQVNRYSIYFVLLSLLGIVTFFLAKPLVEEQGKPFDTAIRDVVILARLKLYGRFFNR